MPTRRSYSTALHGDDLAVEFDIDGESFTAYPSRCPASVVLESNLPDLDANRNPTHDFFVAVLGDDHERFSKFVGAHPEVNRDMLRQIAQDLLEDASGRPTQPSST